MARKGILSANVSKTISGGDESPRNGNASEAPRMKSSSPNVRRFRDTFEDLRAQAVQEIDTGLIGASRYHDRFDASADIDGLVESIREAGQQIPVMLRPAPDPRPAGVQYEPVYGRRRIAACRRLRVPVRALISDIGDDEMIVAQGLENNERLDNSFIEKAFFVHQLKEDGVPAKVITDTLGLLAPEISRMASVVRDVPVQVIDAIGPARGVGRRQWMALAKLVLGASDAQIDAAISSAGGLTSSAQRFAAVQASLTSPAPTRPAHAGRSVAAGRLQIESGRRVAKLKVTNPQDVAFLDWLSRRSEDLFHQWEREERNIKD